MKTFVNFVSVCWDRSDHSAEYSRPKFNRGHPRELWRVCDWTTRCTRAICLAESHWRLFSQHVAYCRRSIFFLARPWGKYLSCFIFPPREAKISPCAGNLSYALSRKNLTSPMKAHTLLTWHQGGSQPTNQPVCPLVADNVAATFGDISRKFGQSRLHSQIFPSERNYFCSHVVRLHSTRNDATTGFLQPSLLHSFPLYNTSISNLNNSSSRTSLPPPPSPAWVCHLLHYAFTYERSPELLHVAHRPRKPHNTYTMYRVHGVIVLRALGERRGNIKQVVASRDFNEIFLEIPKKLTSILFSWKWWILTSYCLFVLGTPPLPHRRVLFFFSPFAFWRDV